MSYLASNKKVANMKMSRVGAMEYLDVSSTLLSRLEKEKKIRHIRIPAGKKFTIWHRQKWLDEFIEKHTINEEGNKNMDTSKVERLVNEAIHTAKFNKVNDLNHPDSIKALNQISDDIDEMISGALKGVEELRKKQGEIKDYLSAGVRKADYS